MWKPKTIVAYVDGKALCDVVDEALRLNITASEMKKRIQSEYAGHEVEFKVDEM